MPENLKRVRKKLAAKAIAEGRVATQMPPFGAVLDKPSIDALVELIYTPPAVMPVPMPRKKTVLGSGWIFGQELLSVEGAADDRLHQDSP